MIKSKGLRTYKQYWENQASFMDKPPWNTEKILKIIFSTKHERNIEELKLSDHSLKKGNENYVLKLKVPYNYLQIDNFESKAMELVGINKDWLISMSIIKSNCTNR